MNKIARRFIAGVSAVTLFASAVGADAFTNMFTRTVSADVGNGRQKAGRSTEFPNLEQDTDNNGNYYNTSYGLHTNKTAEEVDDGTGRTFDVNLESWYVGENPVDVATILDASGSMAWTVNTLDPLYIDTKVIDSIIKEYGIEDSNGDGSNDIYDLIAWQNKPENGGYLPQDVVDKILDPAKTDNSKLGYDGYKYYVYEGRSSVNEFVPLGYWDGGSDPKNAPSLIGYYPFSGDLKNKAPKALEDADAKGLLIDHPESSGSYDTKTPATIVPEATFFTEKVKETSGTNEIQRGLDIRKTASIGGVLLEKPSTEKFSVSLKFSQPQNKTITTWDNTTFLYLTDGDNFYKIYRSDNKSEQRLKIATNSKSQLVNVNHAFKDSALQPWTFTFDFESVPPTLTMTATNGSLEWKSGDTTTTGTEYTVELPNNLDIDKLKIIVGGADKNDSVENYSEVYVQDVSVKEYDTDNPGGKEIAKYDFIEDLSNLVSPEKPAVLVHQLYEEENPGEKIEELNLEPVFSESKYLDVCKTGEKGAVFLDAMPNSNNYTLSFKMKINKGKASPTENQNIIYVGDGSQTDGEFQTIHRRPGSSSNHIGIYEDNKLQLNQYMNGSESYDNEWATITVTVNGKNAAIYVNGKQEYKSELGEKKNKSEVSYNDLCKWNTDKLSELNVDTMEILLAGLWDSDNYKEAGEIYLDDVYVFNTALDPEIVNMYFGSASCKIDNAIHARSVIDGKIVDIAQISNGVKRLGQNTNISERRGWYYVNSHSAWADIEGCLESGKQYIGIFTDEGLQGDFSDMAKDTATIPSGLNVEDKARITEQINAGNTNQVKYSAPDKERSIRFYADSQQHLRCFVWSGDTTDKKGNERTFCSLVYAKRMGDGDGERQITKYEQLNEALNQFYEALAENSDLTNSAVLRFSTNKLMNEKNVDECLKSLIMKHWTNWSDAYTKEKVTEKDKYLHDMLIPEKNETSLGIDESAKSSGEYPYVMTGGTYTWTGLKAFYDNMVKTDGLSSGDKVYNIAKDARDKYLIIFTDGRDNTQDYSNVDENGKPVKTSSDDSEYFKTKYIKYNPEDFSVKYDGELAKAWADKLKDEGYTIFCVMMATGSISPDANEKEFTRAHNFLTTLAGSKEAEDELSELKKNLEEEETKSYPDEKLIYSLQEQIKELEQDPENHVIVAYPSSKGNTTVEAFQKILKQIQQPRDDYTVQDYIDPRFDLVDRDGNVLKLGAGGEITIKDTAGGEYTKTVGDVIDDSRATGYPFIPQDSYMVNRKPDSESKDGYTTGDGKGTGYIYYDDDKDMYYLRWTDQIIPMENEAFDTDKGDIKKYFDVWSATIRLKAKDDFIGGNNILTNGNEAGENLVYSDATIENMDKSDNYKLYGFTEDDLDTTTNKIPYRKKLEALSGTNRKINAVDAGGVSQAVYGNGIDIPSSGFPRVVVDVRLQKLNANDLNDVIYMGEVVSPTMMLADLENGYMTGSYYLEYLERYAYRVYGEVADQMPLIELLNKWLKINDKTIATKTFTIPYIYLPDPEYGKDGKLVKKGDKVNIQNSAGWNSDLREKTDFADLNLRDVTGFITYTWKRDDGNFEEQQKMAGGTDYDITKDYVVKNTNQIKYNLQLKFTPLKDKELTGFTLDNNFIKGTGEEKSDSFFKIDTDNEFKTADEWSIDFTRAEYLQAMVSETKTYEPHVMYDTIQKNGCL